ncbi:hypothetical protein ACF1GR_21300 [Streptomyces albidoflavus]|uniref:hypothetical protein n=1 Tax=Streptomyces albidoflavus TaxID=1886 RepID=UPI0036FC4CAB
MAEEAPVLPQRLRAAVRPGESHAQVGGERRVSSRHPRVRHRAYPGDVLQLG